MQKLNIDIQAEQAPVAPKPPSTTKNKKLISFDQQQLDENERKLETDLMSDFNEKDPDKQTETSLFLLPFKTNKPVSQEKQKKLTLFEVLKQERKKRCQMQLELKQ